MRDAIFLLMFDLPVGSRLQRRNYARFRSGLNKLGYQRLQRSVYYKYASNVSSAAQERKNIREFTPHMGDVQFISMPIQTFCRMRSLTGKPFDFSLLASPIIEI